MAARKKSTPAKTTDKQFWSVILFAAGILILLLGIIQGESAWYAIHIFLRGIFGISVFIVPVILIYASVMIAKDKSGKAVAGKLLQGLTLILLTSGIIQIFFVGAVEGTGFFNKISILYNNGKSLSGGGVLSAVLGWPLLAIFNKTGAAIIILLMAFVCIMLITDISVISFLGIFYKPFRKIGSAMKQAKEEDFKLSPGAKAIEKDVKTKQKLPPNEDIPKEARKPKFDNIDIPIPVEPKPKSQAKPQEETVESEPLPIHPVISPKITKEKLEEKAKTAGNDLEEIIKKAVDTTEAVPNAPIENPIIDENGQTRLYEQNNELNVYKYPPISLLTLPKASTAGENATVELKQNADILVDTLKSFGVQTRIVDIHRGPTVTRYELQPSAGVKISKITGLADDIALNLAAAGVRIEAPIPGKAAVGIEIPNKNVDIVTLRELVETKDFDEFKSKVSFALGRDIAGNVVIADIAKMPHVLIAGSTGSGKSVCINSIIMSLLYKSSPDQVRILMIDPKVVELGIYNGIPHLLIPVVTDPRKAAGALNWAVMEMLKRYKMFADNNVRDLKSFNEFAKTAEGIDPLPQIVIIIDELADLMMAAPNEVEDSICRLAQMARAAGMHLVIATQRPSVDIITGVIKANIPSRIAFAVSSQIDSRTILDGAGAEKLLGRGDMLFYPSGTPKPSRVQGCFVTDKEVEAVVSYIKNEIKADYDDNIMEEIEKNVPVPKGEKSSEGGSIDSGDEMIEKAIEVVIEAGQASTSYLQRKLKLGYARAARIIDELEELGVVGPFEGAKPRTVTMSKEQWYQRKLNSASTNQEAVSHN
ncbi:MAG TPA: DNA translocase FtsK [Oscillospiraceae bacterium]|nr:DNA translocase FtsK [Oscillospiraceae bacterium]